MVAHWLAGLQSVQFTPFMQSLTQVLPNEYTPQPRHHPKSRQSEADPTILRCLESRALFAGYISQQLPHDHAHAPTRAASAGSGPFAVRWCVVAPRVTPPSPRQAAGTVRVELLVYDSFDAAQPKMRVWLTGAAASLTRARRASSLEGIVVSILSHAARARL